MSTTILDSLEVIAACAMTIPRDTIRDHINQLAYRYGDSRAAMQAALERLGYSEASADEALYDYEVDERARTSETRIFLDCEPRGLEASV